MLSGLCDLEPSNAPSPSGEWAEHSGFPLLGQRGERGEVLHFREREGNGAFVFIEIDEYGRETVVDIDSIISIGVRGVDKSTSAGGVALSLGLTVGVIAVAFSAVMIAIIKMTAKRKRK